MAKVNFKSFFNDDIRRFSIDQSTLSLDSLQTSLRDLYKPDTPSAFQIKWTDEDGDSVSIKAQADLVEALAWSVNNNINTIKIHLSFPAPATPTPPPFQGKPVFLTGVGADASTGAGAGADVLATNNTDKKICRFRKPQPERVAQAKVDHILLRLSSVVPQIAHKLCTQPVLRSQVYHAVNRLSQSTIDLIIQTVRDLRQAKVMRGVVQRLPLLYTELNMLVEAHFHIQNGPQINLTEAVNQQVIGVVQNVLLRSDIGSDSVQAHFSLTPEQVDTVINAFTTFLSENPARRMIKILVGDAITGVAAEPQAHPQAKDQISAMTDLMCLMTISNPDLAKKIIKPRIMSIMNMMCHEETRSLIIDFVQKIKATENQVLFIESSPKLCDIFIEFAKSGQTQESDVEEYAAKVKQALEKLPQDVAEAGVKVFSSLVQQAKVMKMVQFLQVRGTKFGPRPVTLADMVKYIMENVPELKEKQFAPNFLFQATVLISRLPAPVRIAVYSAVNHVIKTQDTETLTAATPQLWQAFKDFIGSHCDDAAGANQPTETNTSTIDTDTPTTNHGVVGARAFKARGALKKPSPETVDRLVAHVRSVLESSCLSPDTLDNLLQSVTILVNEGPARRLLASLYFGVDVFGQGNANGHRQIHLLAQSHVAQDAKDSASTPIVI